MLHSHGAIREISSTLFPRLQTANALSSSTHNNCSSSTFHEDVGTSGAGVESCTLHIITPPISRSLHNHAFRYHSSILVQEDRCYQVEILKKVNSSHQSILVARIRYCEERRSLSKPSHRSHCISPPQKRRCASCRIFQCGVRR